MKTALFFSFEAQEKAATKLKKWKKAVRFFLVLFSFFLYFFALIALFQFAPVWKPSACIHSIYFSSDRLILLLPLLFENGYRRRWLCCERDSWAPHPWLHQREEERRRRRRRGCGTLATLWDSPHGTGECAWDFCSPVPLLLCVQVGNSIPLNGLANLP